MALITLLDAQLAFGHVALLDHAGFSLETAERVGLIGRNGAGKSSLLKILGGLAKPDDGSLQVQQGVRIAFVAQEPTLDPSATIFKAASEGLQRVIAIRDQYLSGADGLDLDALLFAANRPAYIYTAVANEEKRRALEALGTTVITMPNKAGKVDLPAMLQDLGRREINELHVEAGYKLNGSLLREGLIDELLVYLAPKLMGEGMGLAQMSPLTSPADAHALSFHSVDRIGDDLRILARLQGRDRF